MQNRNRRITDNEFIILFSNNKDFSNVTVGIKFPLNEQNISDRLLAVHLMKLGAGRKINSIDHVINSKTSLLA